MKKTIWNETEYELVEEEKEGFDQALFLEKVTDYYESFDYILGDYAYGKLRLKGFYESKRNEAKRYNDIAFVQEYIQTCCAYGCRYFLLKKMKTEKDK